MQSDNGCFDGKAQAKVPDFTALGLCTAYAIPLFLKIKRSGVAWGTCWTGTGICPLLGVHSSVDADLG